MASTAILEPLNGKIGFLTGGSGFLGTALACRLVLDCGVDRLYILCRGGTTRLWNVWRKHLPRELVNRLMKSQVIHVFDGDIEKANLGLSRAQTKELQANIQFVVHSASSINLRAKLGRLLSPIVEATLSVADFASGCEHLERFVYVSTAYSNANLHDPRQPKEVLIEERVYPLEDESSDSPEDELAEAQKHGIVAEAHGFPFAYGYAKHLTERLLLELFDATPEKLLIVRPSIIGPAESFPHPGFEVAGSAPVTMLVAGLMLELGTRFDMASPFRNPDVETNADEVPVDIVVNRLVVGLAQGMSGFIHAVSGEAMRYPSGAAWDEFMKERKLFWKPRMRWYNIDWHSNSLHFLARVFMIFGTSYNFDQTRTGTMWAAMTDAEREYLPLYRQNAGMNLNLRRKAIKANVKTILSKKGWPTWIATIACRPVRK